MSVTVEIQAGSLAASLKNLGKVRDKIFKKAAKQALTAAGKDLEDALLANVSFTCHSLEQLARLGHPYSKRWGRIRIHSKRPYLVHKQSGKMSRNITGKMMGSGSSFAYRVGFNYDKADYFKYVVEGTNIMHGRNVVLATALQEDVRVRMMQSVVKVMGKEMRTGAAIRFR